MAKKLHTLIRALAENITEIDILARLFLRNNMSNRKLTDLAKGDGLLTKRSTGIPYEAAAREALTVRAERKQVKSRREVRRLQSWMVKDAALDGR